MFHRVLPVGPLQCNCQIVACPRTNEAILIDPGDEAPKILEAVKKAGLTVKWLVHTHAHFDHIAATGAVRAAVEAPTCLHAGDKMLWDNLPMQGQMFGMRFAPAPELEKTLEDGEELAFGDCKFRVVHTPGHSPGSIAVHVQGAGTEWVASGDTLFQGSIGRSDLWGGDGDLLLKSVRNRLFTMEDDLPVFPGHGPETKMGVEKRTNPFFR